MKRIVSLIRKAVDEYGMIRDNERVAVGVSGGKDSMVLLEALHMLSKYHPSNFTVVGLAIDPGFGGDYTIVEDFAREIGVEFHTKKTQFKEIIFDERKEQSPCSLCSKMRRGALNDMAKEHGCDKLALGHHMDDVLETFFLSLLYEGRVNCFSPFTYLDRSRVTQISPMIYVRECDIKSAVNSNHIPVMPKVCPVDGITKRSDMKDIIKDLEKRTTPGLKKRLFHAVASSGIEGWKEF